MCVRSLSVAPGPTFVQGLECQRRVLVEDERGGPKDRAVLDRYYSPVATRDAMRFICPRQPWHQTLVERPREDVYPSFCCFLVAVQLLSIATVVQVAIKVLPPDLTRDETAKQRFLQEAQAALDHPNMCRIYEICRLQPRRLWADNPGRLSPWRQHTDDQNVRVSHASPFLVTGTACGTPVASDHCACPSARLA